MADADTRIVVLLVDDEIFSWHLLQLALPASRFKLHYTGDVNEALLLADDLQPDLILLDLLMPQLSGLDLCVLLKHNPTTAHCRVVLISGFTELSTAEIQAAKADGFIAKPLNAINFLEKLEQQLDTLRLKRNDNNYSANPS